MSASQKDFSALRSELDLPPLGQSAEFPPAVTAECEAISTSDPSVEHEVLDLPFVTIDPPGSMDLDQAMYLERLDDGFRVHYAIADLGSAIELGGAVDHEARRRGQTVYLPDELVPLHPPALSEDALSLLPNQARRAAVWTIDVDSAGAMGAVQVSRAVITSIARLDYAGVQADADAGRLHPSIEALPDLGRLRRTVRLAAGAIDLALPAQEVVPDGDGWSIRIERRVEADMWNAEVSLLTGMAAAQMMLSAGVGLLRFLPDPDGAELDRFFELAHQLGFPSAKGMSPGHLLSDLDIADSKSLALMNAATRLLRGAGYAPFNGAPPEVIDHAGIGGAYAHVTAPLRRLADRFTTEICLAISAGAPVPEGIASALPEIAEAMRESDRRASAADRGAIDLVEARLMADRKGDVFDAVVTRGAEGDRPAEISLMQPPVVSSCSGPGLVPGAVVRVEVAEVDLDDPHVSYRVVTS